MVNDFDAVFESYIADVSNQEGPFLLLAKSPKVQRVQVILNLFFFTYLFLKIIVPL